MAVVLFNVAPQVLDIIAATTYIALQLQVRQHQLSGGKLVY